MLMNKRQFHVDPIQTKYYICSIRRHKDKWQIREETES